MADAGFVLDLTRQGAAPEAPALDKPREVRSAVQARRPPEVKKVRALCGQCLNYMTFYTVTENGQTTMVPKCPGRFSLGGFQACDPTIRLEHARQAYGRNHPYYKFLGLPPKHGQRVDYHLTELKAREEAQERFAAEQSASVEMPVFESMDDLLDRQVTEPAWALDRLLEVGHKFLFNAEQKAGKSTTIAALLRALVTGEPFLGEFEVKHRMGRVVLLDQEMGENTVTRLYTKSGMPRGSGVQVVRMRGLSRHLALGERRTRQWWAERLRGADLVILDPLRPVLDALGLDENRDGSKFLGWFDALMKDAEVPTYGVVHHMGHGGQRARGDSGILGWADAVWNLRREQYAEGEMQPDDADVPRFFSAYGRDEVGVPEAQVTYDAESGALTYRAGVGRHEARTQALDEAVLDVVRRLRRVSAGAIDKALKDEGLRFQNGAVGPVRKRLVADGRLVSEKVGTSTYYMLPETAQHGVSEGS